MTPEERQQGEREILDEYQEALACLEVLTHRLDKIKRALKDVSHALEYNMHVDPTKFAHIERLRATIDDYEETHTRCTALHESLERLNLAGALRRVPFRPYRLYRAEAGD